MYTSESLGAEIRRIYLNPSDGFMWEAAGSGSAGTDDVVRYCWTAYWKAYNATGPQVIGRVTDLNGDIKSKVSGILEGETLFDSSTQGNVLSMDKWCLVMNDCWLLGGIHRKADFKLQSGQTWQNVWSPTYNGLVVTAREIIGLNLFGYEATTGARYRGKEGAGLFQSVRNYTCAIPSAAAGANLQDYHFEVAIRESRGPHGVTDLIR